MRQVSAAGGMCFLKPINSVRNKKVRKIQRKVYELENLYFFYPN